MKNVQLTQRIAMYILQNSKGMINEKDLRNLCENDEDFHEIITEVANNLAQIGLSLSRTSFQNEKYYVLTINGKDESVSPSMYGTLSLILALYNQIGIELEINEMKTIFKELWADIENLIKINYLQIIKEDKKEILKITPIGKAVLKNISKDLDLKKIFSISEASRKKN